MDHRKRAPSLAAPNPARIWTRADARQLLDEWATSGESLAAFARRHGVIPQRLSWWRSRIGATPHARVKRETSHDLPPVFIPVTVRAAEPSASTPAVVELDGSRVRVELRVLDDASAAWVASLARSLGGAA